MADETQLAPPPDPIPVVEELQGKCPSCKDKYFKYADGTTNIVRFNATECCPDIRRCGDRSLPHTHRCYTCASDDWNYGECDVCGNNGFCDIVGFREPRGDNDHRALSVCYKCATSEKDSRWWKKTSWEKTKNPLGIAKRQGKAIAKRKA